MRTRGKTERFIRELLQSGPQAGCVTWPHGRDGQGYARAVVAGFSTRLSHRIICELHHGKPPFEGAVAMHSCGNGHLGCVNPAHLSWGSVAQNNADKELHGTKPVGVKIGRAILNPDRVREIRRQRLEGRTQHQLAAAHGVHPSTIQAIVDGRSWREVQ